MPAPASISKAISPFASLSGNAVTINNEAKLAGPAMDALVRLAVFGNDDEREWARWVIWETGRAVGVFSASIQDFYVARGKGDVPPVTVPAMNIRGASYDTARAIFRTAKKLNGGAFILEIARSEIAYTEQRPSEYVAVMLRPRCAKAIAGRCSSRATTSRSTPRSTRPTQRPKSPP
jgi:fructose-bisphosphate aldolase class II